MLRATEERKVNRRRKGGYSNIHWTHLLVCGSSSPSGTPAVHCRLPATHMYMYMYMCLLERQDITRHSRGIAMYVYTYMYMYMCLLERQDITRHSRGRESYVCTYTHTCTCTNVVLKHIHCTSSVVTVQHSLCVEHICYCLQKNILSKGKDTKQRPPIAHT